MSLFHERFKALRDSSGKTQAKIAEDLGMTPQALSYYANGREPSYDTLAAIAKYFNVTTDYLLGTSDYQTFENDSISRQIPLSDKAIDFLKLCPPELQPTLDLLLSDPNLKDFLLEVETYIYSLKYGESSEIVDISGSSFAPPEIISRLLPRLQQLKTFEALEKLLISMDDAKYGKED
jgi:transcriptional regulator with XRE-family HTH domain